MDEKAVHPDKAGFERQDLGTKGILEFFAGLVILGVVVGLVLLGMFNLMDNYRKAHQPPQNPLAKVSEENTGNATPKDAESFPQPRLETDEVGQLNGQRLHEEEILNTYGWVDQKAGIARIPIDRAMALIVQRGLATRPGGTEGQEKTGKQQGSANENPGDATPQPGARVGHARSNSQGRKRK
jgi:hypothetical protein